MLRDVRAQLLQHLGGVPSPTERALIERSCMLSLHLARMDTAMLSGKPLSAHAHKAYLGFSNSLSRTLRQLGLKGVAPRAPTLTEIMADTARKRAA